MPGPEVALEGAYIVLVGSFNPAIFHPQWFARQNVTISEQEAENASNVIMLPDLTTFHTEHLTVQVTTDHFQVGTTHVPAYELVRDLAVGAFRVLRHTPIRMLGVNRNVHFNTGTRDLWHAVGHHVAPKEVWAPILENPGTRSLTIEGTRPDGLRGAIRVKLEPSARIDPGVFLDINDHFETEGGDQASQGDWGTQLVDTLEAQWAVCHERSTRIISHISQVIWSLRTDHE